MTKEPLIKEAIEAYSIDGQLLSFERYGSGHVNDTFLVEYDTNQHRKRRFIFQRMSKRLTEQCANLMENIIHVTEHIKRKIERKGGDSHREVLNIVKTPEGNNYYIDSDTEYWRVYYFIEGATCYDKVERESDFYESGLAFGNFQNMLSDFDASKLYETIPGFHDTKKRFARFKEVIKANPLDRIATAKKEIDFFLEHEELACILGDALERGELPLRVTHNDTKFNNVMIDDKTHKAICVIDLDTVMPGLSVNDFGDSIRFGASTALEDEKDLSKVDMDIKLYKTYLNAYIEGCKGSLTDREIMMFPMGAKVMTYECGMRFLTDYLEGDVYFHTARKGHNLDRARTQMKLVQSMEDQWNEMTDAVKKNSSL